jgi:hypothetical protein
MSSAMTTINLLNLYLLNSTPMSRPVAPITLLTWQASPQIQVAQYQGHPTNTFAAEREHVNLTSSVQKKDAYSWLSPKQKKLLSRGHLSRVKLHCFFTIRMMDNAGF